MAQAVITVNRERKNSDKANLHLSKCSDKSLSLICFIFKEKLFCIQLFSFLKLSVHFQVAVNRAALHIVQVCNFTY